MGVGKEKAPFLRARVIFSGEAFNSPASPTPVAWEQFLNTFRDGGEGLAVRAPGTIPTFLVALHPAGAPLPPGPERGAAPGTSAELHKPENDTLAVSDFF